MSAGSARARKAEAEHPARRTYEPPRSAAHTHGDESPSAVGLLFADQRVIAAVSAWPARFASEIGADHVPVVLSDLLPHDQTGDVVGLNVKTTQDA
jgi:hypothetical protein